MDWLLEPWPWWVAGPMIGLTVPMLGLLTGKRFGISSSFRSVDAVCFPRTKVAYFREHDVKMWMWQLVMVGGMVAGGFIGNQLLTTEPLQFLPDQYMSLSGSWRLLAGGVLIGFGTRYANGCTSGHTITGLSQLSPTSLIATIAFFVGGLITTWLIPGFIGA
ncbi:MAG: YeeE/YedE family protein [Acidimicrobiia bacterium]|nr:YeeE/YedE family protein [Acidimicrobiia bacterium]